MTWFSYTFISRIPSTSRHTYTLLGVLKVDELFNRHPQVLFDRVHLDAKSHTAREKVANIITVYKHARAFVHILNDCMLGPNKSRISRFMATK